MERLTNRAGNLDAVPNFFNLDFVFDMPDEDYKGLCKLMNRLCDIEDILGPTYDLSRLKELVEADREGRFLPVSVGQTLYVISHEGVDEEKVVGIISDGKTIMVEISHFLGVYEYSEKNFGKWVFLTREAAEKALEEKK